MNQTDKPRDEKIKTIMSRALFQSGDEFTCVEMTSNLKCSYETTSSVLRQMYRRGLLNRRLKRYGYKSTAYWSKRGNHWLRMSWRTIPDDEFDLLVALEDL